MKESGAPRCLAPRIKEVLLKIPNAGREGYIAGHFDGAVAGRVPKRPTARYPVVR